MRDEFAKIDWLKTRFELDETPSALEVGIGDDAAVIDFGNRGTIVTVDTQVEGVHFRRDLISCRDLGYRAMVAAASDVYAMAGSPSASVIALTIPATLADDDFRELIEGLAEAARQTGARVIGGNLSAGSALSITTSVFGLPLSQSVTRAHARPGDSIYVTGTLGSAALGLAILQSGREDIADAERFVKRWRRPPCNGRAAKSSRSSRLPRSTSPTAAFRTSNTSARLPVWARGCGPARCRSKLATPRPATPSTSTPSSSR
jgi:thiamine-monophosphate kinase